MSNFKFSPDLFLEVAELERFKRFLDTDGFRANLIQTTISYGLIRKEDDLSFTNGRVQRGVDASTGDKTITVSGLQAIDKNGLLLFSQQAPNILVPNDGGWHWVRAKHAYSSVEEGKITLAVNGDLTGVGTKFTEVLRGMPNFPSRIRFQNSQFNTLEYDVLEVISDTQAVIMHPAAQGTGVATFEIESDLLYSVVGTFTPGVAVPLDDKYPFQYDSTIFEVVKETVANQRPLFIEDKEFYLARVKIQGSEVIIQDKRTEFWQPQGKASINEVDTAANPLIGVEYIKWQNQLSPANESEVHVAWGMRTQNWAVDSTRNIVTFFGSAMGGRFKTIDNFTDGDFDGWRLYVAGGKYSRVLSSIKQGQAINLTLDILDIDQYSSDGGVTFNNQGANADWLLATPNVEEIEIQLTPQGSSNTKRAYVFPINTLIARCDVECFTDPTCLFNVTYRYKTLNTYTKPAILPSDTVGYLKESSFDALGALRPAPDRTAHPYVSLEGLGYIELTISPNAYSTTIGKIYKGDKIGVTTIVDFNLIPLYELKVGREDNYQFVTGSMTLTDDVFISLSDEGAVEANEFRIHFDCTDLNLAGKKINIVRNYNSGSPVTIKEISEGDIFAMKNQDGGIAFTCVFSDTRQWNIAYQNYSLGVPNEIKPIDGVITNLFDSNGAGKIKGLFGYGLCDGRLGPNLVDKFILGAGTNGATIIAVGEALGSDTATLVMENIPRHTVETKTGTKGANDQGGDDYLAILTEGLGETFTSKPIGGEVDGSTRPINIKNPYYALIYAKKLF
jgi:hypothetical protein